MDHVVVVDNNYNSLENHTIDYFHMKKDFPLLKEAF